MPKVSNPVGVTGQRLAENVQLLRDQRGMTKAEVSRRLSALGRPMSLDVVTKIEAGTRPVDTDDLVALALVFEVSPNRLMFSVRLGGDITDVIALTGQRSMLLGDAFAWAYDGRVVPQPEEEKKRIKAILKELVDDMSKEEG